MSQKPTNQKTTRSTVPVSVNMGRKSATDIRKKLSEAARDSRDSKK